MAGGEELPSEALVRVFHFLPIKQRSKLACVARSWRQAASVDAVSVKLKDTHVPSYLHVALPDGTAQLQAAACPLMSLARSADLTWASAATGQLLESMPSLERLAFTSMASGSLAFECAEPSGLHSLKSLTNLQSLQLNISDAAPVLEAAGAAPHTLRDMELHLTGENWQTDVLDQIATLLGSQASQLCSLSLRCSHASVYSSTEPLEHLSRLAALTSLRMGPNPEDIFPHSSPLGFARPPSFLAGMKQLQFVDLSMADATSSSTLSNISFEAIRHIPDIKLTLRADTSKRAVSQLPAGISALSSLSSLTIRAFTFEDPGGWCTHALFNVSVLASCSQLQQLDLQLGTWECEHCEGFELLGLQVLTQLHSLKINVSSRLAHSRNSSQTGHDSRNSSSQELVMALPSLSKAKELHVVSSMRTVLRNSKALAKAQSPAVLAHAILLEEPLPQRRDAAPAAPDGDDTAPDRDQTTPRQAQRSAASAPPPAIGGGGAAHAPRQQQQQHVRAPAHVVISALPDLWPSIEVWQYPIKVPGLCSWRQVHCELLCRAAVRESMQRQLCDELVAAAVAGAGEDLSNRDEDAAGMRLLW